MEAIRLTNEGASGRFGSVFGERRLFKASRPQNPRDSLISEYRDHQQSQRHRQVSRYLTNFDHVYEKLMSVSLKGCSWMPRTERVVCCGYRTERTDTRRRFGFGFY